MKNDHIKKISSQMPPATREKKMGQPARSLAGESRFPSPPVACMMGTGSAADPAPPGCCTEQTNPGEES
jgi:hypothetical protein